METRTTVRIDREKYEQAKEILQNLGLSYSQAVDMFNGMIVRRKDLPFEMKILNDETLAAMQEAKLLDGDGGAKLVVAEKKRNHE